MWKIIPGKKGNQCITKKEVRVLFIEFMKIHNTIDAWDDDEFDRIVNMFEDDGKEHSEDEHSLTANEEFAYRGSEIFNSKTIEPE